MWKPIKLPYIFERMLGFSMLAAGRVLVIAYDGVHDVEIRESEPCIIRDYNLLEDDTLYSSDTQLLKWNGKEYPVLGLHGGSPLLRNQWNETLRLKAEEELLQIVDQDGQIELDFKYQDFSGDWAYATFSTDGRWAFLGLPYDLFVFQRGN